MKTINKSVLMALILSLTCFSSFSNASKNKITWDDSSKFTDIKDPNYSKQKSFERFQPVFEEHLETITNKYLQYNMRFEMNITNIDLAGNIDYHVGKQYRVIKDFYPPKINFDYKLFDKDNNLISEGTEKYIDMRFQRTIRTSKRKPFEYEYNMMEQWFKSNLNYLQ